ncbi:MULTISPECIES: outer membrane protein Omp38 [unclassified Acinetobacter]|uniref:outer membrane protein Omp38 n=1 Tax=unclassified Acinetobacter TaxID=196816 RepID=UPI00244AA56D|nr:MULTISPECIES: OmpA family protein [unclassified Acinetobacter]MDH0030577.1 OmpA family protein [Acinetobacter sp. GD04021]MDH0886312.1 OmpA family protein [Acinetobacter sp. GD03873]MDH1081713.1 OmpA family protein [Acinetobacter sp. GD03983]MDH2189789.1 OmpA family protein [Acinetobacter sp. GD03645]MDH2202781.1 OmpA family protein [Acinetobacter sp. GD03647]
MKMSRIVLAMLAVAPFVAVNAGVTITPLMLGYHWYPGDTQDKQRDVLTDRDPNGLGWTGSPNGSGVALQSDLLVGAAIGVELTPWLQAEVEYQQTKADAARKESATDNGQPWDAKHQTLSLNAIATADAFTGKYDSKIKPYALIGGGYSKLTIDNPGLDRRSYDTIGNIGGGVLWELNDALTLRTEGRATYNFDNSWWEGQAMAALQVVVGGHLRPAAPVVEVAPVEPTPVPVQPQPQEMTEDLNMELRVFFDTNKSDIKPQYKSEIAKVAEKLGEFPNATARIEGHTDNTGPRKLNERLSLARANSVKSSLVNEYNVDASRLSTQGFAWDQPIADNKTKEGRAMNRRVFAAITGSRTVVVQPGQQAQ